MYFVWLLNILECYRGSQVLFRINIFASSILPRPLPHTTLDCTIQETQNSPTFASSPSIAYLIFPITVGATRMLIGRTAQTWGWFIVSGATIVYAVAPQRVVHTDAVVALELVHATIYANGENGKGSKTVLTLLPYSTAGTPTPG